MSCQSEDYDSVESTMFQIFTWKLNMDLNSQTLSVRSKFYVARKLLSQERM